MKKHQFLWVASTVGLLLTQLPNGHVPARELNLGFLPTLGMLLNGPGHLVVIPLFGFPFASTLVGNLLSWGLTLMLFEALAQGLKRSPPPIVELVDAKDGRVVFVCDRELKAGKDATICIPAPAGTGQARSAPLKVWISQSRPVTPNHFAHVAVLYQELPFEPPLKKVDSAALRRGERLECRVRVLSPDLPGYSALSTDLSPTGMQLETRSAIDVGEIVRLRLESDFPQLEVIELQARVAWGKLEGNKRFRAGLEFQNLNIEARHQLDEFHRYLKRRQEINLTQRMLESADSYLPRQPSG